MVTQIAVSLLLLVVAGLFVQTLSKLQSVSLGFNRENVCCSTWTRRRQAYPELESPPSMPVCGGVCTSCRRARCDVGACLADQGGPRASDHGRGQAVAGKDSCGRDHEFFRTMQIPIERGREIEEQDREGTPPIAVVSERFARSNFGDADPIGRHIQIGGSLRVDGVPLDLEIVGVAANAQYGGSRRDNPPVVYVLARTGSCCPLGRSRTRCERTASRWPTPTRSDVSCIRLDERVPVTELRSQVGEIDRTINQEIVFARLCTAFAILALTIACVGLYATMAYGVARRTSEIGIRMALGAGRRVVTWMVLRRCARSRPSGWRSPCRRRSPPSAPHRVVPVRDQPERSRRHWLWRQRSCWPRRWWLATGRPGGPRESIRSSPSPRVVNSRMSSQQHQSDARVLDRRRLRTDDVLPSSCHRDWPYWTWGAAPVPSPKTSPIRSVPTASLSASIGTRAAGTCTRPLRVPSQPSLRGG